MRAPVGHGLDAVEQVVRHRGDRAAPVDGLEHAGRPVVVDDVLEGAQLLLQAGLDDGGPVVVALDQPGPADVADAGHARRVGRLVVGVAGGLAEPAPGEAQEQLVGGDVDVEGGLDGGPPLGQGAVERLGLGTGAGEAVQDHAAGGIGSGQPLQEHAHGHLVGDQRSALHVRLGGDPEGGPFADGGPEEITRGHPGKAQVASQDVGLGALARPGCTKQDEDPHRSGDPAASAVIG